MFEIPAPSTVEGFRFMAGYIIGLGIIVFAVWHLRSNSAPAGAIEFTGTVVEEASRRSSQTGRRSLMHAPRVAFQHPKTGADEVYEPSRFGGERFTVGKRTALYYDPHKDSVGRPLDRPFRDTAILVILGVGFLAAQYFSR